MVEIQERRLRSFDETEIAYYVCGDGPAVVLANGLGAPLVALEPLIQGLAPRHRVLSWDYRGMHASGVPRDPSSLTVAHHCDDLERILIQEGIERALFCGWSMGVQLCFELLRRHRRFVRGIVAICGTTGRTFSTMFSLPGMEHVVPVGLAGMRRFPGQLRRGMQALVSWGPFPAALQRVGIVAREADRDFFRRVAAGFARVDLARYATMLEQLNRHSADDLLGGVDVPTLIIAGGCDLLTPPATARAAHRAIPGSRLVMLERGTHYAPIELPHAVLGEIESFINSLEP
jgi:pimeloyl-ACP methyl ester carboxylesterase